MKKGGSVRLLRLNSLGLNSLLRIWPALLCLASLSVRAQDLAELEEKVIRTAVEKVAPSVVRIDTVGGLDHVGDVLLGEGPTSGVIVSADGYVLSSTFNFLRMPSSILVTIA